MPRVIAQRVELDLTLNQVIAIIHQLQPQEQEQVWRAIAPRPWEQRLRALLTRVWSRVEHDPITEETIDAEVEQIRTELYAQSRP